MAHNMLDGRKQGAGSYPEDEQYNQFVKRRQGVGRFWHGAFLAATLVGIVTLVVLLADISNDAFGYVAIQNKVDPESLVVNFYKQQILNAPRVLASEDDEVLASNVAQRPSAIGFFGYAYFAEHAGDLRLVSIDGVGPTAETVDSGQYKLARPLFVYTAQETLASKPQVAAFLAHYLSNVNAVIDEVGYFPLQADALQEQIARWEAATGATLADAPAGAQAGLEGEIVTVGSSTVAPITQRMADDFSAAGGFGGAVTVENVGTDAGFRRFCIDKAADIANASRAMINLDLSACRSSRLTPVELRVANDGIALVVSKENTFLENVTSEQLQMIFTSAERWSDVDPAWPDQPILHYIPGADSGTLDFFASAAFGSELAAQPHGVLVEILAANVGSGRLRALQSQMPFEQRPQEDLVQLVEAEVLKPAVVKTWTLYDSLFARERVEAEAAAIAGSIDLTFRSWVNRDFVINPQSSDPLKAGIGTAIWGAWGVGLVAWLGARWACGSP